ncbi:hypothetical protein CHS0354_006976 [Potamilus streckersoni]|uniref:Uncharacterized protein n=1 Tax=Potamilus streckersoni TaxID=2493646 RepID=A0AAE0VKH9_9BIVA|nr:hypothetical protein CHS0354_006976 [Potamilus streckersoni]
MDMCKNVRGSVHSALNTFESNHLPDIAVVDYLAEHKTANRRRNTQNASNSAKVVSIFGKMLETFRQHLSNYVGCPDKYMLENILTPARADVRLYAHRGFLVRLDTYTTEAVVSVVLTHEKLVESLLIVQPL